MGWVVSWAVLDAKLRTLILGAWGCGVFKNDPQDSVESGGFPVGLLVSNFTRPASSSVLLRLALFSREARRKSSKTGG